jgi:hypothetical protein
MWRKKWGAHAVYGAIASKWREFGGEGGRLGWPQTDELSTPGGNARYNHFDGGSIYWSQATGAHVIWGAIRELWASIARERSDLGLPTSDEFDVPGIPGARRSTFQGGQITWTLSAGAKVNEPGEPEPFGPIREEGRDPDPGKPSSDPPDVEPTDPGIPEPPGLGEPEFGPDMERHEPGPDGGSCFSGDTMVLMSDGTTRAIGTISVGDQVLAESEDGNGVHAQQVERVFTHEVDETLLLQLVDGEQIRTTARHRFFVPGTGFVAAFELTPGTRLASYGLSSSPAVEQIVPCPGHSVVHNLSVANDHTYFVGGQSLLVHNVKKGDPNEPGDPSE